MSDILTQNEQATALAEQWEKQATLFEEFNPDSETARTLRKCAGSLRRWADQTAPDEVTLAVIRDRTGWSEQHLQQRAQDLAAQGQARKGPDGAWRVDRSAALAIPVKRGHRVSLEGVHDLGDLADRILDAQSA